jgi:lysophospholipase L1-like esterase
MVVRASRQADSSQHNLALLQEKANLLSHESVPAPKQWKSTPRGPDIPAHQIFGTTMTSGGEANTVDRCRDEDDLVPGSSHVACDCPDPFVPTARKMRQWISHRDYLVAQAKSVQSMQTKLDVVFLGDSIWEFWNGTYLGERSKSTDHVRASFDKHFVRSKTQQGAGLSRALLECTILATSGDTTTDLLGQLQNGLLSSELQPKAWLFMIGTNNLGVKHCSKRTTLSGIVHVADYVHQQRPRSKIILHGLLPRNGGPPTADGKHHDSHAARQGRERQAGQLGDYWRQIRWINQQLRDYARQRDGWYYVDNGDLFLAQAHEQGTGAIDNVDSGSYINATRMGDGLHPSLVGYEILGPRLVKQLLDILSENGHG